MSSRTQPRHLITTSAPTSAQVGDEYFNPSTNKLFKRLVLGGTLAGYEEVPVLSQVVSISNTTSAFSSTTGALTVAGGAGITGNLFIGGNLTVTGSFSGSVTASGVTGGTAGQLVYQSGVSTTAFAGPGTAGQILTSGGTGAPTYVATTTVYVNRAVLADNDSGGAAGGLRYQTGANASTFLSIGTAGQILRVNSGATAPEWISTGTLYVGRALVADSATGGAGTANNIAGGILGQIPYQLAAGSTAFIGTGTAGTILQMSANTATFVATSTIYVNRAVLADNDSGGAAGGLRYQTGANASTFLSIGTAGQMLRVNAGATAPEWVGTASVYVNSSVNAQTLFGGTAGQLVYQSAANTTAFAGPGTAGQLLVSAGTSAPTYTNTGSIYVGFANQSNNLLAGTAGQIVYQSAAGTTAFAGPGSAGNVLTSNGTSAPTYVTTTSLYVGRAVVADSATGGSASATNIAGGTAGQVPYQTGAGATSFFGPGTAGQILTSGGTGAPTYVATTTVYVNRAVLADNDSGGAAGGLRYQTGANASTFLSIGTAGQMLRVNAGATAPEWLSTGSIYVGFANQANNLLAGTAGQLVYQSAAGTTAFAGPGTAGQLLVSAGTSAPTYTNTGSIYVGFANQANNLLAGANGSIPYQTAAGATTMLSVGASNSILVSNGTVPSWTVNPTIGGNVTITGNLTVQGTTVTVDSTVTNVSDPIFTVGTAAGGGIPITDDGRDRGIAFVWTGTQVGLNTNRTGFFGFDRSTLYFTFITSASITNEVVAPAGGTTRGAIDANLAGGTAGQLHYQSAADTTAFAGPGTAGQVLTSGGTGAPTYVTTTTLYVGRALVADSASGGSASATNIAGGTAGQVPYQTGAGATSFFGPGTAGQILTSGGTGAPTYVATGSIYVGFANQSNNLLAGTAGQLVYQSAAGTTAFAGPGTAGQILTSGGTGAPTYVATTTVYVNRAVLSDNDVGGAAGGLRYQTGANASTFLSIGTAGQILRVNAGATAPEWIGTASIYAGAAVSAINLFGGTAGQLHYQSGVGVTAFAGPGTAGQVLTSGGTGAPTYVTTTTLYVGRALVADSATGGSASANNIAGGTAGQVPYQTGAGATSFFGPGTAGQILTSGGTGAPTYVATTTVYVNRAVLADNDSGGAAGGLRYQTGANASTFLSIGTAGQILRVNAGATAPEWIGTASVYAGAAVSAINLFGGTAGQLHYQSAAGTTAFAGPGTAGQVLTSGGTSAPTYVTTTTLYVGRAVTADSASGSAGSVANALTISTGLTGSPGTTYNGSAAVTVTLNTATLMANAVRATSAATVDTALQTASATYFPTFVDANNAAATVEQLWTTSTFVINPATGRVGINTAAPASILQVTGDVRISGISTITNTTSATSTVTGALQVVGGIGVQSNISIGGALVVGAGDTNQMGVRGEIRATNEITAYFSDRRLKENVQLIDDAVTKVLSIHGITYTPNDVAAEFGFDKSKKLVGVFADEIEAVLPEAVRPAPFDIGENGGSSTGNHYKTVQYEKIVPLLIEAIKEQQGLINKLQADLRQIRNEIQNMR